MVTKKNQKSVKKGEIVNKQKKFTKKQIEEIKETLHKDKIKHKIRVYETYLKALAKYSIKSLAFGSIMYNEMYHEGLCSEDITPSEFLEHIFSKPSSIEDRRKEELEHYDQLISMAKGEIEMLDEDTKLQIAKDCMSAKYHSLRITLIKSKNSKEKKK